MWEGNLQIGDEIHIRFQLATWKFIFRRYAASFRLQPLMRNPSFFFPLGRERIFTCSVICRLLKNCSENWREFSSSDPSSRSNELGFIFSFLSSQTTVFTWNTKSLSHWNRWWRVQSNIQNRFRRPGDPVTKPPPFRGPSSSGLQISFWESLVEGKR